MSTTPRINIEEPRWDQRTYSGRARHFFTTTNPANLFCSPTQLQWAKDVVSKHRKGDDVGLTIDELWRAKQVYDSAFHPDTGEMMTLVGRMSAQVPMNMTITGCMLTFYKTTPAVIFWQWINQSFNAVVNYTNRSGDSPITVEQLGTSYVMATGGALITALGLNSIVKSMPQLVGRLVPFMAVAAANCINIPMMRRKELQDGVLLKDSTGASVGYSAIAAREGITAVCVSRILMSAPGMVVPAIVMNHLDKKGVLKRMPWMGAPLQVLLCGFCLTFATPLCCALFPQKASISVQKLEQHVQDKINAMENPPTVVYYNKGL